MFDFKLPIAYLSDKSKLDKSLYDDLQLLSGSKPLYKTIFNADAKHNSLLLLEYSKYITRDKQYIKDTKKVISGDLPNTPTDKTSILGVLDDIKQKKSKFKSTYGYLSWDFLEFINTNSTTLLVLFIYNIMAPIFTVAMPILLFVAPILVILFNKETFNGANYIRYLQVMLKSHTLGSVFTLHKLPLEKKIFTFLTILFYFYQIYTNFNACFKYFENMQNLHKSLDIIKSYLNDTLPVLNATIIKWKPLKSYQKFNNDTVKVKNHVETLIKRLDNIQKLSLTPAKIANIGITMDCWYSINNDPEIYKILEYCSYYNCFIDNMCELKNQHNQNKINFVDIKSYTKLTNVRYVQLDSDKCIDNTIKLKQNAILTGPNASGKTTFIKSVLSSILLSQQFGCGYYDKCYLNPYDNLFSYLNIPDTCDKNSLFQAEATRCKNIIDIISNNKDKRYFCMFDELFSGTNPEEAIITATAYIEHLNSFSNVNYIITTHLVKVCENIDKDKNIENYKMDAEQSQNKLVYTYKLKKGISNVKGTSTVLDDLNYPTDIINKVNKNISRS